MSTTPLAIVAAEWQQAVQALEQLAHRHEISDGGLRLPMQNGRPLHVEVSRLCSTATDLELGTQVARLLSLPWGDVWCRIEDGRVAGERLDLHRVVRGRDTDVDQIVIPAP